MVLVWAITLLTVILMTCALFLTQVLHTTYFDLDKLDNISGVSLAKHREMYEYFGTFTRSFLSMFEMTLANWPPVTRLLSEEVSEWLMVACLLHKLTVGFAVLGVINGD